MISGDNPLTAQSIARDLGIVPNDRILTGHEISQLSSDALAEQVATIAIYARVSPQNKLDIVKALQTQGHIDSSVIAGTNG